MENSVSGLRHNSTEANQFRIAAIILIDEVTMLHKNGLRCIELVLREIMNNDIPFGGKIIVLGGDFRQTLPVVINGNDLETYQASIKSSPLWSYFQKIHLTTNMRSANQTNFNNWLLSIGQGQTNSLIGLPNNTVQIPRKLTYTESLIEYFLNGFLITQNYISSVILAPTNKDTLSINESIIQNLPGQLITYYSADKIITEDPGDYNNYPIEYLNSQNPSGLPPHTLKLKIGCIVMLLRNLNPKLGLCNGTRLQIIDLKKNIIIAKIITNFMNGQIVHIPRINLIPTDSKLPIKICRRQFPVIPAFAITINKAQGQTFENVGIYLNEPVFSHGQLYVALSRCKSYQNLKVFINHPIGQISQNHQYTKNIVNRLIFSN